MKKVNVYVVARGGVGAGKARSHEYGQAVLDILKKREVEAHDLYLHPNGSWTLDGLMADVNEAVPKSKFVYITFVGSDGESGVLQEICEKHGVAHSGASSFYSKLTHDKDNFKKLAKQHGIKSPYSQFVKYGKDESAAARDIFHSIEIPMIVKANSSSGEEEVHLVSSFQELENVLSKLLSDKKDVLAEKLLRGLDVKVLVKPEKDAVHTCVSVESEESLSKKELSKVRDLALTLHNKLGFTSATEYDFVLTKNGVHLLEANSHPDLLHGRYKKFWQSRPHSFEDYVLSFVN
jgi:D-alanine-D-alanine ligase-like ATP-grasp enzyme